MLVIYIIDFSLLLDWKLKWLMNIVEAIAWIFIGKSFYSSHQNVAFAQVLLHGLILFVMTDLVVLGYNLCLYNIIDVYLPEKLADESVQRTEEVMQNFMSKDRLDAELASVREKITNGYGVIPQLIGFAYGLIGSGMLALISTLFIHKRQK